MSLSKRSISGFPASSGAGSSNKVTLGLLRGKAIATSVPSIKFSAGAEEVVEVFGSFCEEEVPLSTVTVSSGATASPKHERERSTTPIDDATPPLLPSTPVSDPWRFFTGIKGKITKSVEGKLTEYKNKSAANATSATSASPSISEDLGAPAAGTSSVGRSPKHQHHHGNYSSSAGNSRSDSEDISESSLSKTQGGLSTTEGVEMSSTDNDDEEDEDGTPSQSQVTSDIGRTQQQQGEQTPSSPTTIVQMAAAVTPTRTGTGLRYRLRTIRGAAATNNDSTSTETTVGESFLRALQRITGDNNVDGNDPALRTEQGVDVLEDMDVGGAASAIMQPLDLNIENMTITSDEIIEVREVLGSDIRASLQADLANSLQQKESELVNVVDSRTIFNPTQFVDLRHLTSSSRLKCASTNRKERDYKIRIAIYVTIVFLVMYFLLSPLSVYFSGFILGVVSTLAVIRVRDKWLQITANSTTEVKTDVTEPLIVAEGDQFPYNSAYPTSDNTADDCVTVWMNEWPAIYTPETYTVACTQPVHLRLQRHLLRVSNTNARLPKRDMMKAAAADDTINTNSVGNPATTAATTTTTTYTYTRHRIYDLRGATVTLQPIGLTKVRWWSKKYPICIQLAGPDQLTTEQTQKDDETLGSAAATATTTTASIIDKAATGQQHQMLKQVVRKRRRWHHHNTNKDSGQEKTQPVMFSKLMLDDNETISMIDTLDLAVPDDSAVRANIIEKKEERDPHKAAEAETEADQSVDSLDSRRTRLYLFARTCRDKETWYQLLTNATTPLTTTSLISNSLYHNYMDTIILPSSRYNERSPHTDTNTGTSSDHLIWLNALLGRAWYSYAVGGEGATMRLKDRIQRKLATIRLPAFIEELKLSELTISPPQLVEQNVPIQIKWASQPVTDSRGLWVDLDLEFASSVVLILQTKLNLMRLKSKGGAPENEQNGGGGACDVEHRSAIFHSDVDDSAESSSDDDSGLDSDKMMQTDGVDSDGAASSSTGGVCGSTGTSASAPAATNQSPNHKLIRMVDRIADSRLFRAATEYRYVQRALENVRNTDLCLRVELKSISGRVCINIPPPPSDRLWFGFRATPDLPRLCLRALPTVGDYHISLQHVTGWLERRLTREFHKILLLPNMEDIILPGLR